MEVVNPLERPITVGACLIATAVSIWWWLGNDVSRLFMEDSALGTEPWRLLTSTLLHANFIHLAFNALWMFRFGMLLEGRLGAARFGGLFIVLAVGSAAAERALFGGGVGLSGVVYGLFGYLWAARRAGETYAADAADQRTTALFVGWFFFCIAATYTGVLAIANVAHGMGALLGVLVGTAASRRKFRWPTGFATVLVLVACVLAGGPFRSYVNLENDEPPTPSEGTAADQAIDDGNFEEAVTLYKTALAKTPDDWRLWYNLSVAYDRLEHYEDAIEASKKAHELAGTEKTRRSVGMAYGSLGNHLMDKDRLDEALEAYQQAETTVPDNAAYKFNMSICLQRLGRTEEAANKRAEADALTADAGAND